MDNKIGEALSESTYMGAKAVAETVENHFAYHIRAARERNEENLASEPSAQVVENIINTAFWSSLRREEGRSPKISLAFLSPAQAEKPLLFEQPLPLNPDVLTKLAPGVERPGVHLGVWFYQGELYVWGTTLKVPNYCFVLDVSEPGLLVVKHRRYAGFGKFSNMAILMGDQVKVVDEEFTHLPDCPNLLTSLLNFNSPSSQKDPVNVLIQLAVSMRSHGRGGTLLVVPYGKQEWKESIIHPIRYSVAPAFSGLAGLFGKEVEKEKRNLWQVELQREVESLAGLTAIDGATIISDQYELLAFGAKIGRPEGSPVVEKILLTEPIKGGRAEVAYPSKIGGTRHLSAAQFVHNQRKALAMVASQDGRFTIFSWSASEGMVQAHRIDTLLL